MSSRELVTAREIAQRLSMPASRLRRLRADPLAGFPEPLGRLGTADVWEWAHVEGWAIDRGAAAPVAESRSALQPPPTAFIGRRDELRALAGALADERLVVLTGPTGVGKTRLARELWRRHARMNPGGSHFVELATMADGQLVVPTVARAVGVPQPSGRPPIEAITSRLGGRRALLVLDNCEHLVSEAAEVARLLLDACEDLTILATSQVGLGVVGERIWQVLPLSLPDRGAPSGVLATSDAVTLFAARARSVASGFRLTDDLVVTVADICRRLDGIPLAIELAAARTGFITPREILERLDDRFALLTGPSEAPESRHQTLRAAIDWSYGLLSPGEKALLRRVSVFHGGWSLEAAESICADDRDSGQLLADLGALAARSLVVADTSGAATRYSMLESIRLYAEQRLGEAGEAEAALRSHGRWFLQLAERLSPELSGRDQMACLEILDIENDNLRAALTWAVDRQKAEEAQRLAAALVLFWHARGLNAEGQAWLAAATGIRRATPDRIRARALCGLSFLSLMMRDTAALPGILDEGLTVARDADDGVAEGRLLFVLSSLRMFNDRAPAIEVLNEAIDRARQSEDTWCLTHALALRGRTRELEGDVNGSKKDLEEAVTIGRRAHDDQSLRTALILAGSSASNRGDFASADALLREGLERARRVGELFTVSRALEYLAWLSFQRGDYGGSGATLAEALQVSRELGGRLPIAGLLCMRGRLAFAQRDLDTADSVFREALSEAAEGGVRFGSALHGLGDVARARGNRETARELLEEVHAMAGGDQGKHERAAILGSLGDLAREEDVHRAVSLHISALQMRHELRHLPGLPDSLEALGSLAVLTGQLPRAARLLAAGDALRRSLQLARHPIALAGYESDVAALGDGMPGEEFEQMWTEGSRAGVAHAVSYALRGSGRRTREVVGWAALTRMERDVVALVAGGLTNVEVGERLFISPKTVEVHLTHIFGKLGISSRRELAREAMRRA